MKHILSALRDFVPAAQGNLANLLPDSEFYRYLEDNPILYSLVSSAIREGNVTDGNILINHPTCFDPKPGKASVTTLIGDMVEQLRYFARWLATASRKHRFTVFGEGTGAPRTAKQKTLVKPKRSAPAAKRTAKATTRRATAKSDPDSCDEIPKRQMLLRKFCTKVGGIIEAKRIIGDTALTPNIFPVDSNLSFVILIMYFLKMREIREYGVYRK